MGRLSFTDITLNTVDKYTFLTKIVGSRWLDIDGRGLLFVFRTEQDKVEINGNIKKKIRTRQTSRPYVAQTSFVS